MKNLTDQIKIMSTGVLMLFALMLIALLIGCGGSGGGGDSASGGGAPHVPDNTPHEYGAVVAALTNTANPHPVTMHQVCDFGLPTLRDNTVNFVLSDATGLQGGMGCGGAPDPGAVNYTLEVQNTGTDVVYFVLSIDGVQQPQVIIQPGTTYTIQRGF